MAEEDEDLSTETGTDEEGTESGTERGESEAGSSKTAEPPLPPPTELHNSALFVAKYLDQKLDKLFAATEKINVDMVDMEKRIMADLSAKMEANQNALTLRIFALEKLTLEHGVKIQQQENKGSQQAHQLDELQNQQRINDELHKRRARGKILTNMAFTVREGAEGAVKGTETPGGTESEASGEVGEGSGSEPGTESETGTESEATDGGTTDGEETEGEEEAEVE